MADELLAAQAGGPATDAPCGELAWSNELALHLIEMKTLAPAKTIADLVPAFRQSVARANELLAPSGARLMPTSMHPWMDPSRELVLWPHAGAEIYQTFHRAFDCARHGFANLQSQQLNLPFRDDAELGRLLAAVRLVLPILPALSASSPFEEGRHAGWLDGRLSHYAELTPQAPSFAGRVIPEPVFGEEAYRREVFGPIQRDIEALGEPGVFVAEWCNGRGAIPRFDRHAVEIRLLDTQECPEADLAVSAAVSAAIRWLADAVPAAEQRAFGVDALARILDDVAHQGERASIADVRYLRALGIASGARATAGEIWRRLFDTVVAAEPDAALHRPWLERIAEQGCLARRILSRTGPRPDRARLRAVYEELCECLARGNGFSAGQGRSV
jgi:gamma-glutamyl:cysteine ligase YbdK (ATP-grasp superfamily)